MTAQLSARSLAEATVGDPQFRLPDRPALVPGTVLMWDGDDLIVEGTGARRVLSGRSARRLLPDLLPLLDGTRTAAELATALGQPTGRVRPALLLLLSCGLLQDGPLGTDCPPHAVLLGRLLDTTRVNRNIDEAQTRLELAHVGLAVDEPLRSCFTASIADTGVQVTALDAVGVPPVNGFDLAIIGIDAGDPDRDARRALARELYQAGVPVLLAGRDSHRPAVGPYCARDTGACPDCVLDQLDADDVAGPDGLPEASCRIQGALLAVEVTCLIARVGAPLSLRGRVVHDLTAPTPPDNRFFAPRPGCPVCGEPGVPLREPSAASRYEASVAFPPRRLVNPRDHQHHFEAANVALQFEFPQFLAAGPALALPPVGFAAQQPERPASPDEGGLTLASLTDLLGAACGLKSTPAPGRKVQRWAPTGGNLGSPTAYVVARRVAGLAPGCYGYQPQTHSLVPVGHADVDQHRVDEAPGAPATVVLTGALVRVAKKYRTFAYRVVHLDAGVALAHLVLVAARSGLAVRNRPCWDDRAVATALRLDRRAEAVTAVVDVLDATALPEPEATP